MDWSVANTVRRHVAEGRGDKVAMIYDDRKITWSQMFERSARVAQALLAEGVGPEDRIAFLDKNGPEYFEVLFGGGMLNAVNVNVNWRLAPPEVEYIVNDAEARVLFVGPEFVRVAEEIEGGLQRVKKIVVIGGTHDRYESYDAWVDRFDADDPGTQSGPDDVAFQLYTSGTTGLPKGAMLTNTNLWTIIGQAHELWGFGDDSITPVALPLFHIGGAGFAMIAMWHAAVSVLYREFNPLEILEGFDTHHFTNGLFVPAMLQFLCAVPHAPDHDYSHLRSMVYGASPITNDVLVKAMQTFQCDFIQVYGLTETTGAITQLDPQDHDPDGPRAYLLRSAGKPFPWVTVKIVDSSTGEELPRGQVGELWTKSDQNMKGYWNKPDANNASFTDDGWFKSGDAGYMDEDGYIFLTDRIKDMIVSGGENVYPIEIENVLSQHPAVADVAVIGVPDERWGETVKAIVVKAEGVDVSAEELVDFCRDKLAGYKRPTSVDFADLLPRNPSGKLLKRELREPYWQGRERNIN